MYLKKLKSDKNKTVFIRKVLVVVYLVIVFISLILFSNVGADFFIYEKV
jgi:hypothetical protein